MKAILMAAGVGSRISRAVDKPKSALEIGNTTIIAHTADMLNRNGIDVNVVIGFMEDYVCKVLSGKKVRFFRNPFYRATNSIASLWFARELIDGKEDIILANADVFWEQPILDTVMSEERDAMMLGDVSRAETGDYFFRTSDDKITAYGKELKREERNTEYVGISKISKGFSLTFKERLEALIKKERYGLWWEDVLYEHLNETPIYVRDVNGKFWAEVDYIEDYERIKDYIREKRPDLMI
ncbi:MAG: phosphocholine cytidylyltransferase family protein [Methanomassiliicoccaceae archaeon]|nr:phosphocholine cytidylyltransferase family protein [Methanomassiliicoccaceae archaeon]